MDNDPNVSLKLDDSPVALKNLSPQKYGPLSFDPNLSFTPSKLQNNFIYREVSVTKKVENEKNRIRELECLNSLLEQKIKHLSQENGTIRHTLEERVEMYKKMLREQEEEAKRLIKNLQLEFTTEIHKILLGHEEEAKVAQSEKEEYERRMEEYLGRIEELENLLESENKNARGLTNDFNLTSQKLKNIEDKLHLSEYNANKTVDRLNSEIDALNNRLLQQSSEFKQQIDALNTNKISEIQALKRLHLTELDKFQNRKDAQIGVVSMELKDIRGAFEMEAQRLQDIINSKDLVNQSLGIELMKEKEKVTALCRNYDIEINHLVTEKDHLIQDLTELSEEKMILQKDLEELALLFEGERGRSSAMISGLQGEMGHRNTELFEENKRLGRRLEQCERELLVAGNNLSVVHKRVEIERAEEVRRQGEEIRSLKEVLMESSNEMDRCKAEFLRMEMEMERLITINYQCEQEAVALKALISEQDVQLRIRGR